VYFESAFIWLFWIRIRIHFALLDPDPHSFCSSGSGSAFILLFWIRIRIYFTLLDPDLHSFGSSGSGSALQSNSFLHRSIPNFNLCLFCRELSPLVARSYTDVLNSLLTSCSNGSFLECSPPTAGFDSRPGQVSPGTSSLGWR
jgi:hypothetical protein